MNEENELTNLKEKLKSLKEQNKKLDEIDKLKSQIKEEEKRIPQNGFIGIIKRIGRGLKMIGSSFSKDINKARNNPRLNSTFDNLHKSFIGDSEIKFNTYFG